MLSSKLSRHSQAHSRARFQVPSQLHSMTLPIALDDTPSLLGSTLPNTLSRGKTLPILLDYMLPWMLLCARSRDLLSCRRQAPGDVRLVAGDGCLVVGDWRHIVAKIMTSVDIIVWTLSWAWPPWPNLTMPHGHGVDNCSLRFCRNSRQFDLAVHPQKIFPSGQNGSVRVDPLR